MVSFTDEETIVEKVLGRERLGRDGSERVVIYRGDGLSMVSPRRVAAQGPPLPTQPTIPNNTERKFPAPLLRRKIIQSSNLTILTCDRRLLY